ncbi:glycerol-3-phosphate acyltransferase [Niabella sp. W65]|nr:glycerol-3-phosphate acyltransferase [Niabella sp. W65]MCH7362644.1 glycerol-3-phosphate acyltransferase [Niabella sp. W65]ULT38605.1 glycerol-3-phosphate acyltransferase [Niabella sp. I65]
MVISSRFGLILKGKRCSHLIRTGYRYFSWTALACSGVFLLVLYLTRFVSLSSILASVAFPVFILVIFNVENHFYRVFAVAVALLVILTHQKNIGRMIRGGESKVPIFKKKGPQKAKDQNS